MRLFYAIELNDDTRQLLSGIQSRLKPKALRGNFTRPENLHLTLRFMGEVEPGYFAVLKRILDIIAGKYPSFRLQLSGPGVFDRGHKSIVWWGIKENGQLLELQKALEQEIRLHGFPPETKAYSPHITLAREFASEDSMKNVMNLLHPVNHQFHVPAISLMESARVDGKLTYLCRYRAELLPRLDDSFAW